MNPWPRLYDVRHIWWISPVKVPTVLGNDPEDWFLADTGVKQLEESVQSSFASTNHNIPEMFLETNFMGLMKKEVDPIKVSLNKSSNSHLAQGFEILERPLIGTMLTPSCLVWYWMNNFDEHEQSWNSPQLWSLVWWWKEPSSPSLLRRPSFSSQSPDERISTLVRDSRKQNTSKNICIWLVESETTMPTGVKLFPPSALDKPTTFTFFVEKPREKYLWTPASLCQPVWATQPCHCPCNRTTGAMSACRWPGRYKM